MQIRYRRFESDRRLFLQHSPQNAQNAETRHSRTALGRFAFPAHGLDSLHVDEPVCMVLCTFAPSRAPTSKPSETPNSCGLLGSPVTSLGGGIRAPLDTRLAAKRLLAGSARAACQGFALGFIPSPLRGWNQADKTTLRYTAKTPTHADYRFSNAPTKQARLPQTMATPPSGSGGQPSRLQLGAQVYNGDPE